jgi:hypothetical protein
MKFGFLIVLFLAFPAFSQEPLNLHTERDYQEHVNKIYQGKLEHRLKDNTRVDILTDDLAIEIDFAHKWYEAVGQSCHYATLSGKRPAILLIVRNNSEEKYVKAAANVCRNVRVDLDGKLYAITLLIYRDIK